MAEVLALIVTVGSLVDMAAKAGMGLHTAYQTLKDAPDTVQSLSLDLDAFHAATQTLHITLQSFSGKGLVLQDAPFNHMNIAVKNCKQTIEGVRKMMKLEEVEGDAVRQEAKLDWARRFRFWFKKQDILELLSDLERKKATLNFSVEILMVQ